MSSRRRALVTFLLGFLAAACGAQPATNRAADGTWVGTVTTEGNVTTVVNESGSVWGGTARLVEEASIGVRAGPEHFMLGEPGYLYGSDDRIYVVEWSVPTVRVYDMAGRFLVNLGSAGEGPGEYGAPIMVAATDAGNAWVYDQQLRRIVIFDEKGDPVGTLPFPEGACCQWPFVLSPQQLLRAPIHRFSDDRQTPEFGVRTIKQDGTSGPVSWQPNIEYEPLTINVGGQKFEFVPFSAGFVWTVSPTGIVAGVSNAYRFEHHRDDGSVLVVDRYWSPVPTLPAERAWFRERNRLAMAEQVGDWTWDGDTVPDYKPAYDRLFSATSGAVWVLRSGHGRHVDECAEPKDGYMDMVRDPCWVAEPIVDVFGRDGRYLGGVEMPKGLMLELPSVFFVRDEMVLATIEDDAGTIMVKRYRLVLPSEQQP